MTTHQIRTRRRTARGCDHASRCCCSSRSGIFEFGRAYQTWQILTNAAREGARMAVLPDPDARHRRDPRPRVHDGGTAQRRTGRHGRREPLGHRSTSTAARLGLAGHIDYPFSFIVLQPVARLVAPTTSLGGAVVMHAQAVMRNETSRGEISMARMRITLVLLLALAAGGGLAFGTYRYMQNVPVKTVSLPTKPVVVAATDLELGAQLRPTTSVSSNGRRARCPPARSRAPTRSSAAAS